MRRILVAAALLLPEGLGAQGWRLALDARGQATSYRGWRIDSLPASDTTTGAKTPDGFVAQCDGGPWCRFWRPGAVRRAVPTILTADGVVWGIGIPGLTLHGRARFGADLGRGDPWYGPDRTAELVEGYADLDRGEWEARVGRQVVAGRVGWWGVDGARGWWRPAEGRFEFSGYAGWGLARSSDLTASSAALDPLGDFQTSRRQRVLGITGRWSAPATSADLSYHREWSGVDGGTTIERASIGGERLLLRGVSASGGAIYDVASGLWGSWDAGLAGAHGRWNATARVRQYRPLFDLWSIWQAFSPTAYHALSGSAGLRLDPKVAIRATGERYWYDDTGALTPLVTIVDRGWRASTGVTWTPAGRWMIDGELRRSFGVGALANSVEGSARWTPRAGWNARLGAGHLARPLEYRTDVSTLNWLTLGVERQWDPGLVAGLTIDRWGEERERPDASQVAWSQYRVAAELRWRWGSEADLLPLPPGRPRRLP